VTYLAGLMSMLVFAFAGMATISGLPDLSTHRDVKTDIEIKASAATVWHVLTDFSAYELWNPYIYPASGKAVAGHEIDLTLRRGTVIHYTPTVLVATRDQELSWGGKIPFGAVERVVTFVIQPLEPHRVRFIATEHFQGPLLPLAQGVTNDAAAGLSEMARALRDRAELLDFAAPRPTPIHLP
jgi:hypothetical protein